jgi:hypothetical protein
VPGLLASNWLNCHKVAQKIEVKFHRMTIPNTEDVIRRFNRDTAWLATGILGVLIIATLLIGVQERSPKRDDRTEEASRPQNNLMLNGKPATRLTAVDVNQESSNDITVPKQAPSGDRGYTENSPQEDASPQMETATPPPTQHRR